MVFEQIRVKGDRNLAYLIGDDAARLAAIVDAGEAPELMLAAAEQHGLKVAYVISTHSHRDHICGNAWLVERTDAPEVLYEGTPHPSPIRVRDNDELALGSLRLRFLFTPGHIPDHVCILIAKQTAEFEMQQTLCYPAQSRDHEGAGHANEPPDTAGAGAPDKQRLSGMSDAKLGLSGLSGSKLLTGDLLFVGKIGGTGPHFPGSDPRQEWDSLHRLILLGKDDPDIEVWPGHDYGTAPSSTLGREIAGNPFLLCKTYDDFIYLKDHWAEYKKAHGLA